MSTPSDQDHVGAGGHQPAADAPTHGTRSDDHVPRHAPTLRSPRSRVVGMSLLWVLAIAVVVGVVAIGVAALVALVLVLRPTLGDR